MKVIYINDADRWNGLLQDNAKAPSVLQSYQWGEFKSVYGWGALRLAVVGKAGAPILGAQVLVRRLPGGFSFFYSPRGPWGNLGNGAAMTQLTQALTAEARRHRALFWKVDPAISTDQAEAAFLIGQGFLPAANQIQPQSTIILNLQAGADQLLMSFSPKTRYNIRLSARKGVTVADASNPAGVEAFYQLLAVTATRDQFLARNAEYYLRLFAVFGDLSPELAKVYLAYYNGVAIGGVYLLRFGNRIWYMYGASSNAHRNVMPNHALHWQAINWACAQGLESYDLWGVPQNPQPSLPLYGVYRFKKGFGGQLKDWVGCYDLPFTQLGYKIFTKSLGYYTALRNYRARGTTRSSLEN